MAVAEGIQESHRGLFQILALEPGKARFNLVFQVGHAVVSGVSRPCRKLCRECVASMMQPFLPHSVKTMSQLHVTACHSSLSYPVTVSRKPCELRASDAHEPAGEARRLITFRSQEEGMSVECSKAVVTAKMPSGAARHHSQGAAK